MSILGWVFFGLITGWIASKIVNRQGEGCFLNIALGMLGAVVGGALFSALGKNIFWGFDLEFDVHRRAGRGDRAGVYHAVTGRRTLR